MKLVAKKTKNDKLFSATASPGTTSVGTCSDAPGVGTCTEIGGAVNIQAQ